MKTPLALSLLTLLALQDAPEPSAPAAPKGTVHTLVAELDAGAGGIELDAAGRLLCADFGSHLGQAPNRRGGHRLFSVDRESGATEVVLDSLRGASGNTLGPDGCVYQSSIGGNFVTRLWPDGTTEVLKSEHLQNPVGLAVDAEGHVFVASCGANSIVELRPDGSSTVFATDALFACPNGLAMDDEHNLYVCNFGNGDVLRVSWAGEVERLATLPGANNGHLVLRGGALYVVSRGGHRIWRVSLEGEVTPFAGSGERGRADGPLHEAQFSFPNDLVFTPDGRTLYVNENASATEPGNQLAPLAVRRIELDAPVPADG